MAASTSGGCLMTDYLLDEVSLPSRKTVYSTYTGPRKGLGGASRLLYSWVGTYFADQIGDVTVCFSDLAAAKAAPGEIVEIEVRFDVDDHFSESTQIPDGLELKRVPPETLLLHTYEGPLTTLKEDVIPWLEASGAENDVKPGYRQRMVRMAKRPTSPNWEVEVALVLKLSDVL
jgi:hypothetical protein